MPRYLKSRTSCFMLAILCLISTNVFGWTCSPSPPLLPTVSSSKIISQPIQKVVAALADTASIQKWLMLANHAVVLNKSAKDTILQLYLGGSRQIPLQDVVLRITLAKESTPNSMRLCMSSIDTAPDPAATRVEALYATWTLTAIDSHSTKLELDLRLKLPFDIPLFMAPITQMAPEQSLRNLDNYLAGSSRYQNPEQLIEEIDTKGFFDKIRTAND